MLRSTTRHMTRPLIDVQKLRHKSVCLELSTSLFLWTGWKKQMKCKRFFGHGKEKPTDRRWSAYKNRNLTFGPMYTYNHAIDIKFLSFIKYAIYCNGRRIFVRYSFPSVFSFRQVNFTVELYVLRKDHWTQIAYFIVNLEASRCTFYDGARRYFKPIKIFRYLDSRVIYSKFTGITGFLLYESSRTILCVIEAQWKPNRIFIIFCVYTRGCIRYAYIILY